MGVHDVDEHVGVHVRVHDMGVHSCGGAFMIWVCMMW